MKHIKGKCSIFLITLLLMLLALFLIPNGDCPVPSSFPPGGYQLSALPDYIYYAWPVPDSHKSIFCYIKSLWTIDTVDRGIGVSLTTMNIDQLIWEQDSEEVPPLYDRVDLFLDDNPVASNTFFVSHGAVELVLIDKDGQVIHSGRDIGYEVSWGPFLFPGKHTAKVIITRDTGEKIAYIWSFRITFY